MERSESKFNARVNHIFEHHLVHAESPLVYVGLFAWYAALIYDGTIWHHMNVFSHPFLDTYDTYVILC